MMQILERSVEVGRWREVGEVGRLLGMFSVGSNDSHFKLEERVDGTV